MAFRVAVNVLVLCGQEEVKRLTCPMQVVTRGLYASVCYYHGACRDFFSSDYEAYRVTAARPLRYSVTIYGAHLCLSTKGPQCKGASQIIVSNVRRVRRDDQGDDEEFCCVVFLERVAARCVTVPPIRFRVSLGDGLANDVAGHLVGSVDVFKRLLVAGMSDEALNEICYHRGGLYARFAAARRVLQAKGRVDVGLVRARVVCVGIFYRYVWRFAFNVACVTLRFYGRDGYDDC